MTFQMRSSNTWTLIICSLTGFSKSILSMLITSSITHSEKIEVDAIINIWWNGRMFLVKSITNYIVRKTIFI